MNPTHRTPRNCKPNLPAAVEPWPAFCVTLRHLGAGHSSILSGGRGRPPVTAPARAAQIAAQPDRSKSLSPLPYARKRFVNLSVMTAIASVENQYTE